MKVFVLLGVFVSLTQGALLDSLTNNIKDIKWTNAINDKLCAAGTHPDAVAQQFFACYNDQVPGAKQFVECQKRVYGVEINSEKNVDTVCAAPDIKFNLYAACILSEFALKKVNPPDAIHALNQCQGKVMGVAPPA